MALAPTTSKLSFEDTKIAFSSKTDFELQRTYWLFKTINQSWLVNWGTKMVTFALDWRLPVQWAIKSTIFAQFCGGVDIEDCQKTIEKLSKYRVGTILDYSVEGEKSERGFNLTAQEIKRTIIKASEMPEKIPFSVFKITGVANFDILAKLQANENLTVSEKQAWKTAQIRIGDICETAYNHNVRIFIDAEESWIQNMIDDIAYNMMEKFNQKSAIVYNTYQMYCHVSLPNIKKAFIHAQKTGYHLGAKIVRGAYMEKERARAKEKNYLDPIQPNKEASDRDFDLALVFCVENKIAICAGTHNEQSSLYLADLLAKNNILPDDKRFFFAQLYGMSDHISYNLAQAGYNVAKYLPYGDVKSVMPYLMRRARENTSVAGQSSREYNLVSQEMKRRRGKKDRKF